MTAILVDMKWYLIIALLCTSITANELRIFSRAYWPFVYLL